MRVSRRLAIGLLVGAASLTSLSLAATFWWPASGGLRLDVATPCTRATAAGRTIVVERLDSKALPEGLTNSGCAQARWSGFWALPKGGAVDLKVIANGSVGLSIDGRTVLDPSASRPRLKRKTRVLLDAGPHAISVEWSPLSPARRDALRVTWRPRGGAWRPLDEALLFPALPSSATILATRARPLVLWLTLAAWLVTGTAWALRFWADLVPRLRALARAVQRTLDLLGSGWRPRLLAGSALTLILLYGAALRLDALIGGYWPDPPPEWTQRVSALVAPFRPTTLLWSHVERPYAGSDPAAYLRYARQMRNPYEPRVREPMFVMATKLGLWLTGGRDVGVSVASWIFSVLAIGVTYLLGAYAFSRWVGLAAALALAIEHQAIAQGVVGFRDEAFAVFVVLTAWAALRLYRNGAFADALLLGFAGGAAWLTRITTPTLLLPLCLALLAFPRPRPWRQRLERVGVAALIACALMAPFMINCAIVYGDPFYSINQHVVFYRVNSSLAYTPGMTTTTYLRSSFRPAQMADTVFIGYTEYPFGRKWSYEDWSPVLGPLLARLAIAGLALWLFSRRGRLLLLAHLATMVAFAFTYEAREGGPWRLTFHAYPFYLLAASSAIVGLASLLVSPRARRALRERWNLRRGLARAAVVGALALAGWTLWHGLAYLRFAESLRAGSDPGRPASVSAGWRDAFFFAENWHPAVETPDWPDHPLRYSRGGVATLRLPLPAGRGYAIVLGLDPVVSDLSQQCAVSVALNGRRLTTLVTRWNADKMGRYAIHVPAPLVVDGGNRLTLTAGATTRLADSPTTKRGHLPANWETAFVLRYVIVRPAATPAAPTPERPRPESSAPAPPSASPGNARRAP